MAEIVGKGTIFNRYNTGTSQWVAIGQIMNIDGPSATRDTVDVTTLSSTGGYRKFIGGLRDGGDISLPMLFDRDTYTLMKADFESDVVQKYQIVLPDSYNTTLEFEGIVTDLPLSIPVDDKVTADISIKVSGPTTLTSVLIVESVKPFANILVANGTQLADIGLAADVACTFDNATIDDVDVVWDNGTPMYDGGTAGTYVFVGTLVPTGQVLNVNGLTATVKVKVA